MINPVVEGFDYEQWVELVELSAKHPRRQLKDKELSDFIEENPDNITALILAFGSTEDIFLRNKYAEDIAKVARENGKFDYLKDAGYALWLGNRPNLAEPLLKELKTKYPFRGLFADFCLRFENPRDLTSLEQRKEFVQRYVLG